MKPSVKMRGTLIAIAVAGAAAAGFAYYRSAQQTVGPSPVTAVVTRGDVVETIDATGTIEAVVTVQVGTQVSGTIQALYADFNSMVRRGQVIARLDPSLFQTQVEQAQATVMRLEAEVERARVGVADAQLKLRRARDLYAARLIPLSELDAAGSSALLAEAALVAAEAQVKQARASLAQAEVNLAHTTITAPIDGIVISRNVDVGQTVAASMQAPTLFVIARDLTRMQVRASVSEADIGRVQPGQAVAFRVDAYPDDTFSGSVGQIRLQPIVEQNVVSYTTVIDVQNPELKLKPGMTATVTVEVGRNDDVLRVPNAALRFQPTPELLAALGQSPAEGETGGPMAPTAGRQPAASSAHAHLATGRDRDGRGGRVWVLHDGRLDASFVRLGVSDGATTAVLSGDLVEGAAVVTGVSTAASAAQTGSSPLLPFGGRAPGARGTGAGR